MTSIFLASCKIFLNKSMSIWHIRWIWPGWIFYPQKPHTFGNEWHTACYVLSGILFVVEEVEGMAYPFQSGPLEFEYLVRKTVGLFLHMMESHFFISRYVIIDSGFCVLKELIQSSKKGGFDCVVIKKGRYWPYMVQGK